MYPLSEIQPTQDRSILARIFLSPDEPRLRAGWRLLIQTILLFVFGVVITIASGFLGPLSGSLLWSQILNFSIITGSVYVARRWLDKRSFESLGLKLDKHTLLDILAGIGITFVQMGFIWHMDISVPGNFGLRSDCTSGGTSSKVSCLDSPSRGWTFTR